MVRLTARIDNKNDSVNRTFELTRSDKIGIMFLRYDFLLAKQPVFKGEFHAFCLHKLSTDYSADICTKVHSFKRSSQTVPRAYSTNIPRFPVIGIHPDTCVAWNTYYLI